MFILKYSHFFDAAHQLHDSDDLVTKKCANLHGHTYKVIVEMDALTLNKAGMVMDFARIKEVIDVLDHKFINDVFKEKHWNKESTAENIAEFLYNQFANLDVHLVQRVSVYEGYKGEDRGGWVTYERA